jgi:hypothetical protein
VCPSRSPSGSTVARFEAATVRCRYEATVARSVADDGSAIGRLQAMGASAAAKIVARRPRGATLVADSHGAARGWPVRTRRTHAERLCFVAQFGWLKHAASTSEDGWVRLTRIRQLVVVTAGVLGLVVGHPPNALADPVVAAKQSQYRRSQRAIAELDRRSELVTERYDRATWRLTVVRRQIAVTTERLQRAEAELAQRETQLSSLLVQAYKGGHPAEVDIVLGASSFSQVTTTMETHDRLDAALARAVEAVRTAREAIVEERDQLIDERRQVRHELQIVKRARRLIRIRLARRRVLVRRLGVEVAAGVAGEGIGQGPLALRAAGWIEATQASLGRDSGAWLRDHVALEGLAQIGVPYKWGGASPSTGFDCSGLLTWLWARHHVALPHFAAAQYAMGPPVARTDLQIGDLVFFHDLGHMGMYIGRGYVLHVPHTRSTVRIDPLSMGWFQRTYVGATRPGPP